MSKLLVLVFFGFLAEEAWCKFSKGILNTAKGSFENWRFLERFCFLSEKGLLKYEFLFPTSFSPQYLYLYYDSASQWPAVYKSKTRKTCQEKSGVLKPENNQIIKLADERSEFGVGLRDSGCSLFTRGKQIWYNCTDERKFLSYRERWWYLALANCNSTNGLYVEYRIWMTNGDPENFWFYQFSADEFLILPTDIAFLLLQLFTFVVAITVALLLRARQMFHQTYKLFLLSLVLEILSLFCDCVAYGEYARNGFGLPMMKLFGGMNRAGSKLVFLLLLILMGKGYTVTRGRLSMIGSWKISLFMTTYTLVYGTLFIWQARVFDPGEVLYMYDSPAGYGILIMRIVGWIWFCYAVYFTLIHYPEKRGFYYRFSICFSIWFWLGPALIMLSNHLLENWHREKVVNGVENCIQFLGFAAFLFITRPSAANTNFPYHVRTTQIDVLNESDETESGTNLPHHTYELGPFPKDDVFTVSGRSRVGESDKSDPFTRVNPRDGSPAPSDPLNRSSGTDPPPPYEETVSYTVRPLGVTLGSAEHPTAPVI